MYLVWVIGGEVKVKKRWRERENSLIIVVTVENKVCK